MDINPTITPNETEFINTLVRDFLNHPLCSTNYDQKNPWFKQAAAPRKVISNDLQFMKENKMVKKKSIQGTSNLSSE